MEKSNQAQSDLAEAIAALTTEVKSLNAQMTAIRQALVSIAQKLPTSWPTS